MHIIRLVKFVNKTGQQKSSVAFDKFLTIYLSNMDSLITAARSNKVATTLAVQGFSQLRKEYRKELADGGTQPDAAYHPPDGLHAVHLTGQCTQNKATPATAAGLNQ